MTIIHDRDTPPADTVVVNSGTALVPRLRGDLVRSPGRPVLAARAVRAAAGWTAHRTVSGTVAATRATAPAVSRVGWRYLAGRPLSGVPRTDATFLRRGTVAVTGRGRTGKWSHLRGIERAGIRAVAAITAYSAADHFAALPTELTTDGLAALMLGYGIHRTVFRVRTARHTHRLLRPLAKALAPLMESTVRDTLRAIHLPADYHTVTDGEVGRIILPDHLAASTDQRKAIDHLITSRLPIDVDLTWRTSVHPLHLALRASPKPPAFVPFAEMTGEMARCAAGEVILGLDRRGDAFRGNWNSDDPHWGASVGSGRGKSSWLQLIAAQILHQDTRSTLTGIDPKMASFTPLIGIPGVLIYNDPRNIPDMWDAIARVRAEMERRLTILEKDPTAGERFPFTLLLMDEINMFAAMSAAIWRELKEKGQPATPPMWMDVASILWMGRAARVHVVMVGQRLDNAATGGIGLRDSLGFRALSGYTAQQWAMLVGTTPVPRSQRGRGRWIYSDGQDHTWVQNVYGNGDEIRDYAMAGRPLDVSLSRVPGGPLPAGTGSAGTGTPPVADAVPGVVWVVGLTAGADYLGLSGEAFKKRRHRAGGTLPGEVQQAGRPAWSTADLDTWRASWPRVVGE